AIKPAATKPAATKPTATKPAATKPAATKPAATKPAATKPAATKPAAAKPAKKSASKAKVAAADELPDKASAVKGMAAIAKRTAAGKKVNDDDLKKIKGVGPKLEKLLKGMGITSYRQVANLKKEDINIVTAAIESFPGRIERDNWMRSAGKLHKDIYGAMP
ncbi:MAG: ABC transporter, partial [Gammaproteobacteria bacterium]